MRLEWMEIKACTDDNLLFSRILMMISHLNHKTSFSSFILNLNFSQRLREVIGLSAREDRYNLIVWLPRLQFESHLDDHDMYNASSIIFLSYCTSYKYTYSSTIEKLRSF